MFSHLRFKRQSINTDMVDRQFVVLETFTFFETIRFNEMLSDWNINALLNDNSDDDNVNKKKEQTAASEISGLYQYDWCFE